MQRRKLGPAGGSIASLAPFPRRKAPDPKRRPDDGARSPTGIGANALRSACAAVAKLATGLAPRLAGRSVELA